MGISLRRLFTRIKKSISIKRGTELLHKRSVRADRMHEQKRRLGELMNINKEQKLSVTKPQKKFIVTLSSGALKNTILVLSAVIGELSVKESLSQISQTQKRKELGWALEGCLEFYGMIRRGKRPQMVSEKSVWLPSKIVPADLSDYVHQFRIEKRALERAQGK